LKGFAMGCVLVAGLVLLVVAAIEGPKQVGMWAGYAGHRWLGAAAGSGELAYKVADTMENEARWRAAVAGVADEDWRKTLDGAWSRAAEFARDDKQAELWVAKEYVDGMFKENSNVAVRRKEAVLASLVESLARGDGELEALSRAKEVAVSFGGASKKDPLEDVRAMLGSAGNCSGASLSKALAMFGPQEGACRGLVKEISLMYWLIGMGWLALSWLLVVLAGAAWRAWGEAIGQWSSERKSELLARWESEQMEEASKGSASEASSAGRSKRI
jgi:hypothetical protein